jgi:hypothetical protein
MFGTTRKKVELVNGLAVMAALVACEGVALTVLLKLEEMVFTLSLFIATVGTSNKGRFPTEGTE